MRCFADGTEFTAPLEGASEKALVDSPVETNDAFGLEMSARAAAVEREEDDSVCGQQSCSWSAPEFWRFRRP